MKETYTKGVAVHRGPESCIGSCKGSGEALTGENAGQVSSSEITIPGCRPCFLVGKAIWRMALSRVMRRTRGVLDPVHVWTPYVREPGDPRSAREAGRLAGRSGKVCGRNPDMYATGKSDTFIVPMKPPNKVGPCDGGGGGGKGL